jgi:hypothetical protein
MATVLNNSCRQAILRIAVFCPETHTTFLVPMIIMMMMIIFLSASFVV